MNNISNLNGVDDSYFIKIAKNPKKKLVMNLTDRPNFDGFNYTIESPD